MKERRIEGYIFDRYFPTGRLDTIPLDNIPERAITYFESKSKQYRDWKDYRALDFHASWVVTHENGDKTYVVKQTKTYATSKDTETLLYLVDMRGNKRIGVGEVRYNQQRREPFFVNKPFLGYTYTEVKDEYRHNGLGSRRIKLLNAFTHMLYGYPLHSDTGASPESEGVWKKLMEQGLVRSYKEGSHNRYAFIDKI